MSKVVQYYFMATCHKLKIHIANPRETAENKICKEKAKSSLGKIKQDIKTIQHKIKQ